MHLVFDIFQGIGLAAAVGIRPFLPALAAGALAAGDVELDFKHTQYAFLQSPGFLLALVAGVIVLTILERLLPAGPGAKPGAGLDRRPLAVIMVLAGAAVGAVFFAGELCRGHAVIWPGYVAGPVCAVIAATASQPLFARARARLDADAAKALPLYAEGAAILLAVLSVLAPPVGPIGLAFLLWLLIAGRGRGESKYAGLRILR
ncbi:MAG TPA: hypothetical protein VIJ20_13635 [Solirubrobacteraceae bacterium]